MAGLSQLLQTLYHNLYNMSIRRLDWSQRERRFSLSDRQGPQGPRQAEGKAGERWTYPGTATAAIHTRVVWIAGLSTAGGNSCRPVRTTLSHRLTACGCDLMENPPLAPRSGAGRVSHRLRAVEKHAASQMSPSARPPASTPSDNMTPIMPALQFPIRVFRRFAACAAAVAARSCDARSAAMSSMDMLVCAYRSQVRRM